MKRFLCDFFIIMFLLLIGVKLDNPTEFVSRDEQLKHFEESIVKEDVIESKESSMVMHQIYENKASNLAMKIGNGIKFIVKSGIVALNTIFEIITKS